MSELMPVARAAMIGAIALLVTTDAAAARARHHASARGHVAASPAAAAPAPRPALALAAPEKSEAPAAKREHRLILQVNSSDPAAMNLALNNANNVAQYYQETGEPVKVEVVAFGPGLHMLREDTSPVKARIETMALSNPEISFKACGNTQENMHKVESKDIPIVPQAEVVKSGVVHIMELEEQGWTYVKP
ncbi:DsrE family protein [Bradyrhizobium sp.]|uniref:DsrE family protein n=1 Tax=Bradyrhizobium sp. TaxID=376 RepID=UPI0025C425DF|nr:DsrE family protein [Bradyrhizobium sp.]